MRKSALKVSKFPVHKQRRLHALLDKNSEGTITAREKATLEKLVAEAERLMVANAKRLARFSKQATQGRLADAKPVTVWIHPGQVAR